jgi:hypothetical protein
MNIQKKNLHGEVVIQYEGKLLHRAHNSVTLEAFFNREDLPFMDLVLKKGDRFVETFYTDRWYNIFEIYDRDDSSFKGWYCNIGRPAVLEDDLVSYVDLALDLWVAADGSQTVLDEDEFLGLNLGAELERKAYESLEELRSRFKSNSPAV